MNKLFYPAIFHIADEGGFWVSFPDIPECLTEGDNIEQAYEMAVDALGLCITDQPTSLKNVFISRSVVTNRHSALHGTACPSQAKQSNVFILLNIPFSRFAEANKKPPHL